MRYLDLNGDGSGSKNANGNYSITPDIFYIEGEVGKRMVLQRLLVAIQDTTGGLDDEYGDTGAALSNGIDLDYTRDGETIDLLEGPGEMLEATMNDNLTGLVEHTFFIQGYEQAL